ncbi:MAG: DUF2971 domain-containing protein [Clostridiales bacterium]|nr:DUF2971 domain-containing protein [Clostridiales bacterium]
MQLSRKNERVSSLKENSLYHYTDFSALDGILSNSELRLNNVLNMNDASEMLLFMDGLCRAVSEKFRAEGDADREEWTKKTFSEEKEKEFVYSAYAACFSCYRDDAAQWERYANRGRGVCIAFREDLLRRMAVEPLSLETVFYQDNVGEHELVERLYQLIRENGNPLHVTPEIREALNHALAASAEFNHPSFASEKEFRLVVSPFEQGFFDVKPRYHVSKERIKKYYPVDLQKMCQMAGMRLEDLLPELIVGPESTQSIPILQDYLNAHGYARLSGRVSQSASPLRDRF